VTEYLDALAQSLRDQEYLGLPPDRSSAGKVASAQPSLLAERAALEQAIEATPEDGVEDSMYYFADVIFPLMGKIHEAVDGLEIIVADDLWPLPTYQEMLFTR